jgi:hypothetical protein
MWAQACGRDTRQTRECLHVCARCELGTRDVNVSAPTCMCSGMTDAPMRIAVVRLAVLAAGVFFEHKIGWKPCKSPDNILQRITQGEQANIPNNILQRPHVVVRKSTRPIKLPRALFQYPCTHPNTIACIPILARVPIRLDAFQYPCTHSNTLERIPMPLHAFQYPCTHSNTHVSIPIPLHALFQYACTHSNTFACILMALHGFQWPCMDSNALARAAASTRYRHGSRGSSLLRSKRTGSTCCVTCCATL